MSLPPSSSPASRPLLAKLAPARSQVGAHWDVEDQEGAATFDEASIDWSAPSSSKPLTPEALAWDATLPQGMSLRALGRGDRLALFRHWMALGADGLRWRFFNIPPADFLARRAATMNFNHPRTVGIFSGCGTLACVGEWARLEDPSEAEAAFSTHPDFRRQGLAKIVAKACAAEAREAGVERLRIDTLKDNVPARALAASLGAVKNHAQSAWGDALASWIELDKPASPAAS